MIHYSRKTKKMTVLLDNLWFVNGIVLSPEEDFLVVSDLGRSMLVKYWLKEGKFGETETFAEGLPGGPDNLSSDKNGVWAALALIADPENPFIPHSMAPLPLVRKFVARLMALGELFFTTVDKVYPNEFSKCAATFIGSSESAASLLPDRNTILRFDWNGNIIAAYHAFDGKHYTHVMEMNGHLYLGSIAHDHIAKVVRRAHL